MSNSAMVLHASTTRYAVAAPLRTSRSATAAIGASSSRIPELLLAVVLVEIGGDRLDVFLRDRRAEGVDHLVDRRRPAGLVEETRVHLAVVEAVAREALHSLVAPGRVLQPHLFLLGARRACGQRQCESKAAH